jgi:rhomboid family GlyGly-CTERM serine protease
MFRPNRQLERLPGPGLVVLIALIGVVLGLVAMAEPARSALRYERTGLAAGEWWRLVGAHLVHLGWRHALLDLAGVALAAWLFGRLYEPLRWLWIVTLSAAAVDAGLWWLTPGLEWYVGLSGVLHGVVTAAGVALARLREPGGRLLLAAIALKLGVEQWLGPLWMTAATAGGPVVVDAHLYGACGGLLAALVPGARSATSIMDR